MFPDFQQAVTLTLEAGGTINGNPLHTWSYTPPRLELKYAGRTDKMIVAQGRDWENKKACLIFTGLSNEGLAVWGKK